MKPKISVIIPVFNTKDYLQRALNSVPMADDVQLIVIDDGSTDGSWQIALDWWNKHIKDKWSIIHRWTDNHGVAAAMNLGFSLANGEYIGSLSSDDYYREGFGEIRKYLDGKNDLVYFDLKVNDGSVWHLDENSKKEFVGAVKFIRKDFLGDTRVPTNRKYKEDTPFSRALYAKNPNEVFTGIVLKHYNFPREGSLSWQAHQDYQNNRELWAKNSGQK